MRGWGYQSTIYAEQFDPKTRKQGEPFAKYDGEHDSKVIFHYCAGSAVSDFVYRLGKRIVMIYHNITPYEYFRPVNYKTANITRTGREDLSKFASITELALGDSEFNRLELENAGFQNTGVLPITLNPKDFEMKPDSRVLRTFSDDDFVNLLFVGRIAPNKKHEDVLKVFAYYLNVINPKSRLFLVGSSSGTDLYLEWLKELASKLGLENVHFVGRVNQSELIAYYKLADAFICMSEHEGFCVPLLESMHFQVPIVAYSCPGVEGTLGDAGILVKAKEYDIIAEALHVLVANPELRQKVIRKQTIRLQDFAPERVESMLRAYLSI